MTHFILHKYVRNLDKLVYDGDARNGTIIRYFFDLVILYFIVPIISAFHKCILFFPVSIRDVSSFIFFRMPGNSFI